MSTQPMTVIRVVDLETTSIKPADGSIIEFGSTDVIITQERGIDCHSNVPRLFGSRHEISPENRAVHHILDGDLAGCDPATVELLREEMINAFVPADYYAAANAEFEKGWLPDVGKEWICTVKCAARLFPGAESHSNQATRYRLGLCDLGEMAMPPHRAGPDAYVTAHILREMIRLHPIETLLQWSREPRFYARCPIGKHKGQAWSEVPGSYLTWMANQPDMDEDLKSAARQALEVMGGQRNVMTKQPYMGGVR